MSIKNKILIRKLCNGLHKIKKKGDEKGDVRAEIAEQNDPLGDRHVTPTFARQTAPSVYFRFIV